LHFIKKVAETVYLRQRFLDHRPRNAINWTCESKESEPLEAWSQLIF